MRENTGAGTRRPTLAQAMAAAPQIGVTPDMADNWWHAREASDWMKGAGGGATTRVGPIRRDILMASWKRLGLKLFDRRQKRKTQLNG